MPPLEAVDAKVERARNEIRLLKTDITAFCEERARLIVREVRDGQDHWIYLGDAPKPPVQWSVRAGESAYNLRSALDHLAWQLVESNGGRPGKHTAFPILERPAPRIFKRRLCGASSSAMEYIQSVQPYRIKQLGPVEYPPDSERVCRGLAMLHEICNTDKHRHLAIANARWTGEWIKVITRLPSHPMPIQDEIGYLGTGRDDLDINYELQNGKPLLIADAISDWQYLQFPIDAFFDGFPFKDPIDNRQISVSATLDACMDSVEMVVSALRREF